MPVVNQMNALSEAERQQAYNLLKSTWASVSPEIMSGFANYWNSFNNPYDAWVNSPKESLRTKALNSPDADLYYYDPSVTKGYIPEGGGPAYGTPDDNLRWAYTFEPAYTGEGVPTPERWRFNPSAKGIFGVEEAGASFIPLEYLKRHEAHYKSIDPNFDLSKIRTINHPVIGPVVLPQDVPQLDQTMGEQLGEMAQAAAIVGAGALGISGFAGLHGLPGIDSLLGGFTGGGPSDPWLGGFDTWTPEAISGYLNAPSNTFASALQDVAQSQGRSMADLISSAWTENGVPMSPAEAQAYIDAGGTGIGATSGGGGFWDSVRNLFSNGSGSTVSGVSPSLSGLLSGGLQAAGGFLSGQSATNAARTAADSYVEAAKIAADAAKFRPVGVTTNFGSSRFTYGPDGNLASAGYSLSPQIKSQQDSLMGVSNSALTQYTNAQNATAPMGQTAQTLFGLGQGYLGTTPQEQAARYMEEQQALLAPYRERDFANLENRLLSQGRLGLATGATSTGLGAANPEMEAFYNAQRMQDLKLASEATKGGMDYTRFGAGLVGTGGDLLNSMYQTQTNAYTPYRTAIGGASMLEGLGQNAMDLGINIGAKGTAANAQSGQLLAQGMQQAAQTMLPANSYSPWGALLSGAGTALQNYQNTNQQQYRFDPYSGQQIRWGA